MKKVILLTLFLALGTLSSNAQIRFGLKGGANFSNFTGNDADGFDNLTSFYGGALVEINVFENFAVQPEVLYSSQGAKVEGFDDVKLDYINVPVLAKFYLITDKLALEAGPQFGFLINDDFDAATAVETKSFDFAAIGGASYNITDNFFLNARYVIGLTDTTEDAEIKNTTIQVGAGFRF